MSIKTHIVIIGGSYSGIGVAQNILASTPNVKITLINTSKDWYFNIAAARILSRPNSNPLSKIIFPIKENFFAKYNASQFEFIHGSAAALDTIAKAVTLDTSQLVKYDYLVIATGSRTAAVESGIPVKQPVTDTLVERIEDARVRIANAASIVIAGGGAVAIEFAGELAEAHPDKHVTIVSGAKRLLPVLSEKASGIALKRLKMLGVDVVLGNQVLGTRTNKDKTIVELDNGKTVEADLYIPAMGVIPNNSFIPPHLLDAAGYLITSTEQKVSDGVYALGDVTNNPTKMASTTTQQVAVTVANLKNDIEGRGKRRAFKMETTTMVVPIGAKGGVAEMGDLGGLILWSWLVAFIKGNFFISVAFMISGFKKQ